MAIPILSKPVILPSQGQFGDTARLELRLALQEYIPCCGALLNKQFDDFLKHTVLHNKGEWALPPAMNHGQDAFCRQHGSHDVGLSVSGG